MSSILTNDSFFARCGVICDNGMEVITGCGFLDPNSPLVMDTERFKNDICKHVNENGNDKDWHKDHDEYPTTTMPERIETKGESPTELNGPDSTQGSIRDDAKRLVPEIPVRTPWFGYDDYSMDDVVADEGEINEPGPNTSNEMGNSVTTDVDVHFGTRSDDYTVTVSIGDNINTNNPANDAQAGHDSPGADHAGSEPGESAGRK